MSHESHLKLKLIESSLKLQESSRSLCEKTQSNFSNDCLQLILSINDASAIPDFSEKEKQLNDLENLLVEINSCIVDWKKVLKFLKTTERS